MPIAQLILKSQHESIDWPSQYVVITGKKQSESSLISWNHNRHKAKSNNRHYAKSRLAKSEIKLEIQITADQYGTATYLQVQRNHTIKVSSILLAISNPSLTLLVIFYASHIHSHPMRCIEQIGNITESRAAIPGSRRE